MKSEGGGGKGRRQKIKKDRDQKEKATRAALHARIRPTSISTSTHLLELHPFSTARRLLHAQSVSWGQLESLG